MKVIIEKDKITFDNTEYVPVEEKAEIKVGDTVSVKDPGMNYSGYCTWPGWREAPIEYAIRYQFESEGPNTEDVYMVRYIGKHEFEDKTLAVIERIPWEKLWDKCYLVNTAALEKVRKD